MKIFALVVVGAALITQDLISAMFSHGFDQWVSQAGVGVGVYAVALGVRRLER